MATTNFDDRTRVKRQKLSEEPGTPPLSVDGSAIVEALTPEESGTSFHNAIELHDDIDMASASAPLLHGFNLESGCSVAPAAQLQYMIDQLRNSHHIQSEHFVRLSLWLQKHLRETNDDTLAVWLEMYSGVSDFASKLADLSISILRHGGEIFRHVPDVVFDELGERFVSFVNDLAVLSTRIILILPQMIDRATGRRDSGQIKVQQTLRFLWYAHLLAQILVLHDVNLGFFKDSFQFKPEGTALLQKRQFLQKPAALSALTSVLHRLGESLGEIDNAWVGILAILRVLKALCAVEGMEAIDEVERAMATIHHRLLPTICVISPRALPMECHETLVRTACVFLAHLTKHASIDQSTALYNQYIKSDVDALLPHSEKTPIAAALRALSDDKSDTLSGLLKTAWNLQALKFYVFSSIMDVRSSGILQLSKLLVQLYNTLKVSPEGFNHPTLQYAGRFMRANRLPKYIFGPDSHASLISHSKDIIAFLAATSLYTDEETDLIWEACTTSVEAEFAKASFHVLTELCRYLDLDHLLYVVKKYAATSPNKLGQDAIDMLTDLFAKVHLMSEGAQDQDRRLTTALTSIEILLNIGSAEKTSSAEQLRVIARDELLRFTSASFDADDRSQIYNHCLPNLLEPDDRTTTSIEIMLLFLGSSTVCLYESQSLLNMVSVDALVSELSHFVKTRRADGSQKERGLIRAIRSRIDAIIRLQALPNVPRAKPTWTAFFDYTVGQLAINNAARDCAWRRLAIMGDFQDNENVRATARALLRHCHEAAISLPLAFLTPTLINVYGDALHQASQSSDFKVDYCIVLQEPIWLKLLRTAESTAYSGLSGLARKIVCDVLFEYPCTYTDKSGVIQCQTEFVRSEIGRIRQGFIALTSCEDAVELHSLIQQIDLLAEVLYRSRQETTEQAVSDIILATGPMAEVFHCRLQVYVGGQARPKLFRLHFKASTKLSDLARELPKTTSADASRVIISGREIDLEAQGDQQISQLGIGPQVPDVIMISPKHTYQSDLGRLLTPTSEVERELLTQYAELEMLLDGPEELARKMFEFIIEIPPPQMTRQRLSSPELSTQDLLPSDRMWRSAFSIHTLKTHLQDYARLGVVDETFRLRSIGRLVEIIIDGTRPIEIVICGLAMDCLLYFLQEQPSCPSSEAMIKFPSEFVSRIFGICDFFLSMSTAPSAARCQMVDLGLKTLIEAFRRQPSVWQSFTQHAGVTAIHQRVFMHGDTSIVVHAINTINNFCAEAASVGEVTDFYMNMTLDILPHALEQRASAKQFFALATQTLLANPPLQTDESRSREILGRLVSHLRSYQHSESVELPIIDLTMAGLLKLLIKAIKVTQRCRNSLDMDGLALEIFTKLLFPPTTVHYPRPLVDRGTRALAYELITSTCESEADMSDLLAATAIPLQELTDGEEATVPGMSQFVRPASQCSGLTNLGMTCYMNSLLQQLFANVHLRKFIFDTQIRNQESQELLYQVQHLFARMQSDYGVVADTTDLARALGVQKDSQEDVHGFYEDFLSRLEASMPDDLARSALRRFFSGTLISQIKGECGHISAKTEPFVDLQMIVKNKDTLLDSLQESVQGEPMEGTNKYKCLSCDPENGEGRLVNAMRRSCPEKLPDNLTFCLKRFSFESMYGYESKVNDRFEFPQSIDMSRWLRAQLDDPEASIEEDLFELVGVIVHQGSLQLGHYWSYTLLRNTGLPDSRTWVKLEDRSASPCPGGIEEVRQECFGGLRNDGHERADNAYVLFYQRKSCLEEQISLPGASYDPISLLPLPPKVPIPPALQGTINRNNRRLNRIKNLFDEGFHNHILWLLSDYDQTSRVTPPEPGLDSKNDIPLNRSPRQERNVGDQTDQLSKVTMIYLMRVAASDVGGIARLDRIIAAVTSLLATRPQLASGVLNQMAQDQVWLSWIVIHSNLKIQGRILSFVLDCLSNVREQQDETLYRSAFKQVTTTHSAAKDSMDPVNFNWKLYLDFAVELSQMGSWELATVLDCGYFLWAMRLIYLPLIPEQRQKWPGLLNHMEKYPSKVSALYEFLHTILGVTAIVSSPPDPRVTRDQKHHFTPDGVLLSLDEADLLYLREAHWMTATRFADFNCGWKDFAPGKMLGSLLSPRHTPEMNRLVRAFLEDYIGAEENIVEPVLHLVVHLCANSSDGDATLAFHTLARTIHQWSRAELGFLEVARAAYEFTPCAVASSVELWIGKFMLSRSSVVRRTAAQRVRELVFEPDCISDNTKLDTIRIRQTRKIVKHFTHFLMNACDGGHSRDKHESAISMLMSAEKYLRMVQREGRERGKSEDSEMRGPISAPLKIELAELPNQLAELKAFKEVAESWEVDEPLPASRNLVELSSDEETSESEMHDDVD